MKYPGDFSYKIVKKKAAFTKKKERKQHKTILIYPNHEVRADSKNPINIRDV